VYAHAADKPMYETPQVMSSFMADRMKLEPVFADVWVKQGDILRALGTTFEVRHVPGHCPGNVLFYSAPMKAAFVGDALFAGSVGRTDFPGGSMEMLADSIRREIYTLPDDTVVYPGHGPETTVSEEKQNNPYVQA
jgi:glyoxylase-like metal-dependent hydrolase (beta-lactamase superfamily II)